jgi:outer membrane protein
MIHTTQKGSFMHLIKIPLTLLLLLASPLFADTIGGEISVGFFNHAPSGKVQYNTDKSADFTDTLGFETAQDIVLKAYIEHPFPLFPNLRLGYSSYLHNAENLVPEFSWGEIQNYTGTIDNHLQLNYLDTTLYYEFLDNWLETDAGFTFRSLKGEMSVKNRLTQDTLSFSSLIPMLYAKARINIPNTDISFQLEGNAITLPSTSAYDYELSARYTFTMGLGLELGYKAFYLSSDDLANRFDTTIEFTGLYAAAIWDF